MRLVRYILIGLGLLTLVSTLSLPVWFGKPLTGNWTTTLRISCGIVLVGLGFLLSSPALRSRLNASYRATAVAMVNCILLIVIVNVLLGLLFEWRDSFFQQRLQQGQSIATNEASLPPGAEEYFLPTGAPLDNGLRSDYQLAYFDYTACREQPAEQISRVLDEFYEMGERGILYQPWVQFSESTFEGETLNIGLDKYGFPHRLSPGDSESPDGELRTIDVFTFGGSTTFGYHVSDDQTWPHHLQLAAGKIAEATGRTEPFRVRVTNYGRGAYNPTQEATLLWDLLRTGHRPDLVIFMDGVNMGSFMDVPHFTRTFVRRWSQMQSGQGLITGMVQDVPILRLLQGLNRRVGPAEEPKIRDNELTVDFAPVIADRFVDSWAVAAHLCTTYNAQSLFCLQPAYAYGYNTDLFRHQLTKERIERWQSVSEAVYTRVENRTDCIDLSGLYARFGEDQKAILDDCHYTPEFNRFIAETLTEQIDWDALRNQPVRETGDTTGKARFELIPSVPQP